MDGVLERAHPPQVSKLPRGSRLQKQKVKSKSNDTMHSTGKRNREARFGQLEGKIMKLCVCGEDLACADTPPSPAGVFHYALRLSSQSFHCQAFW